ncbi:MAG: hypothetical protein ABJF10_07655 [Chthoniobacter sp.]|uniref:hypothetical protein n=1 Tax=Chthoniobacter sp. TaxID=2510640 RepID=UPI0032A50DAF
MNFKTKSILAAVTLAISNAIIPAAQAGPGPHDSGVIAPRPIATQEVTTSCSRCQQPAHTVAHHTRAAKKLVAAAVTPAAQKVL